MKMDVKATPARFDALWQRCLPASRDTASRMAAELVLLYSEPHRHFHTLGHIDDCVRRFDEIGALMKAPDAGEMALWFHDAIYRPGAPDNEERSIELFQQRSAGTEPTF